MFNSTYYEWQSIPISFKFLKILKIVSYLGDRPCRSWRRQRCQWGLHVPLSAVEVSFLDEEWMRRWYTIIFTFKITQVVIINFTLRITQVMSIIFTLRITQVVRIIFTLIITQVVKLTLYLIDLIPVKFYLNLPTPLAAFVFPLCFPLCGGGTLWSAVQLLGFLGHETWMKHKWLGLKYIWRYWCWKKKIENWMRLCEN